MKAESEVQGSEGLGWGSGPETQESGVAWSLRMAASKGRHSLILRL